MSQIDIQYNNLVKKILEHGVWDTDQEVRPRWKDGTPAHSISIISQKFIFDNSEVPILTSKKVHGDSAIQELRWIWQMKSNVVQDLRDMGVNIWNEWEQPDGTIGKAYGYQLGKKNRLNPEIIKSDRNDRHYYIDQVDYLLHQLKYNPASRRHITTLWNPDELDKMALTPCVYETQWYVKNNKLSLEVRARSSDVALGLPFNLFQYNVLQRMIAQITGYELGQYIFNIGDCHIYDKHVNALAEQVKCETYDSPTLEINPEIKNFYDFKLEDFNLKNYQHGKSIKMEVAV